MNTIKKNINEDPEFLRFYFSCEPNLGIPLSRLNSMEYEELVNLRVSLLLLQESELQLKNITHQ